MFLRLPKEACILLNHSLQIYTAKSARVNLHEKTGKSACVSFNHICGLPAVRAVACNFTSNCWNSYLRFRIYGVQIFTCSLNAGCTRLACGAAIPLERRNQFHFPVAGKFTRKSTQIQAFFIFNLKKV